MPKEKKQKNKKEEKKKPAHEVLLSMIKSHYESNVDGTHILLSELDIILNTIIIPADKISEVRKKLMNIFTKTSTARMPVKNAETFRCLVAHFQKEYPE